MKNTIKTLIFLFLCISIGIGSGCKKEPEMEEPLTSLKGTKWKLEGYVNVATGKMTEAEPKDREPPCYMLMFDTDSTAVGGVVLNKIWITLKPLCVGIPFYMDDSENGNAKLFYEAIKSIESYTYNSNELRFFYNNKHNYLLYKFIKS